jgi:hypothetical protein
MNTVAGALLAVGLSIGAAGALAETNSQPAQPPAQPKAGEQGPPKTVGAMQNTVGDKATSPEDVKRQTEGKPTMAQEAQQGDKATHPNVTEHAPGTVGAAPGTTPPSGRAAKK